MLIISNALVDTSVKGAKVMDRFQFERVGYFTVDSDSTNDKVQEDKNTSKHCVLFSVNQKIIW